jgi:hypothetical protein
MNLMPHGWSVDVDEANIVLTVPTGHGYAGHVVSRAEARVLKNQLHLAYLLADKARQQPLDEAAGDWETIDNNSDRLRRSIEGLAENVSADYEIRDQRQLNDGASIEAWLAGWHWPATLAVKSVSGTWLVLVDRWVAESAGLGDIYLTGVSAKNADHALEWVKLLAALYVKAAAE